ncbi:hypothetical protein CIT292_09831 [Citrobacter youngae ATCC 29220]|uniref:Uncharacterized protein n=1 Tax=Citrobacter youngae ATCC 29220 TaxID=500640 RepID=D4BH24_9ENTR|nr:hypothetical protein CIT292_09831 [Citrobacter youngae ATCC 29220]
MFPAPAGINRRPFRFRKCAHGVPRASGDKPRALRRFLPHRMCSPRQRG